MNASTRSYTRHQHAFSDDALGTDDAVALA